jgi:glyoxylase-like metal-dependent hydrolase (beta-lactamase superfamily II)
LEVDPGEIRHVVNSHLHSGHAAGNVSMPNAKVVVQREEWAFAHSPDDFAYEVEEFIPSVAEDPPGPT